MAATDDDAGDQFPYDGKVMLAAVISLSVVIFFVLLLHIYARWLLHMRQQQRQRRPMLVRRRVFREPSPAQIFPGHAAEARLSVTGVDPKVVAALPVFVYRAAEHEHGVECVVCLSPMEEEESGRRLPKCKHAFHVGCIDMWLASHATCPICRSPVRAEAPAEAEGDAAAAVEVMVESEEEAAAQVEELCAVLNEAEDVEVVVDMKEDESSSSSEDESSSSFSSSSVTTTSSSSSSFGSSLMRMLSKGRS